MQRFTIVALVAALLVVGLGLATCGGRKQEVAVEIKPEAPDSSDAVFYVVRMMASLFRDRPEEGRDLPREIMLLTQGDQVTLLERAGDWAKVIHDKSGETGWVHSSFLFLERRSRWWSGDTERARTVAKKFYQDKAMMERGYPVSHVTIEERFHKLVFETPSAVDFPREKAAECAVFWAGRLIDEFPAWKDHQVFISARDGDEEFTVVVGDELKPTFL